MNSNKHVAPAGRGARKRIAALFHLPLAALLLAGAGMVHAGEAQVNAAASDALIIDNDGIKTGVPLIVSNSMILTSKMTTSANVELTGTATITGQGAVPKGAIIMWSGDTIPDGWNLCDGNNSNNGSKINGIAIPDLRGRFVVGYKPGDKKYEAVGHSGGAAEIKLKTDQIPAEAKVFARMSDPKDINLGVMTYNSDRESYLLKKDEASASIAILPPYYALAYIIFVGK